LSSTIIANVSGGDPQATINYTFYCNRNDNSTNITPDWNAKFDAVFNTSQSIVCNYNTAGTYYPKVIVERGNSSATDKKPVIVNPPANQPPTASNLNVNVAAGDSQSLTEDCRIISNALFSWNYADPENQPQSALRIQIDNNSNFASPEYDTQKQTSGNKSYSLSGSLLTPNTYYWRLMVWDSEGQNSGWLTGSSFNIYSEQAVNFSWSPYVPLINQAVSFSSQSTLPVSSYAWTFPEANPNSATNKNPSTRFQLMGPKTVKLKAVIDSQICAVSKTVVVGGRIEE
jgi:hypothetical protein